MKTFMTLAARNMKMFFKDKGLFLVSMITPIILLVLYVTFLADVYRDGIAGGMPEGFAMPDKVIGGLVSGEVASSMLAVICVTVSFCSNMVMVQDKISGASKDLSVTPVKKSLVALSYFAATLAVTLIICIAAMLVCFIYVGASGWFLSAGDVFLIILDIILLTLFGTALSSIINCFISTQGQSSAVGTIVSAGYGFFCGAYMPISSMGSGSSDVCSSDLVAGAQSLFARAVAGGSKIGRAAAVDRRHKRFGRLQSVFFRRKGLGGSVVHSIGADGDRAHRCIRFGRLSHGQETRASYKTRR